mmetsp:Transcript_17687/g.15499  ORF Transcript_17687/g.15499 Transcript_17687/m.15499 type:complete len:102 (-) Transcript_17687:144-449(-)
MVRSSVLKNFEKACADKIVTYMSNKGIKFIFKHVPIKIEKLENGQRRVTYKNLEDQSTQTEDFDTVMFAIGRTANTNTLNLEGAGVKANPDNHKILVNEQE